MKKISVLLIAFLLVASFAFGQTLEPSVELSGDASLTFGVDLEEGQTGFSNASSATLTLTVVPTATETSGPDGSVSGIVEIAGLGVAGSNGDVAVTAGSVTAWVFVDPVEIMIYSAPKLDFNNVASWTTLRDAREEEDARDAADPAAPTPAFEAAGDDVPGAFGDGEWVADTDDDPDDSVDTGIDTIVDGTTYNYWVPIDEGSAEEADYQGFTVTVPAGELSVSLMVASLGSWEDNVDNLYATGLSVSGSLVEGVTGSLGGFLGPFGGNTDDLTTGVSADLGVAIDIVSVNAGMDVEFDSDFGVTAIDTLLGIGLDLDVVSLGVDVFAYTDELEFDDDVVIRAHVDAGGLDENLSLMLTFETEDTFVTDGLEFAVKLDAAYDIDGIRPYAAYTFYGEPDLADSYMDLTAGVSFTGFVPMTVFTLQYAAENLTESGATDDREQYLTFETKVTF